MFTDEHRHVRMLQRESLLVHTIYSNPSLLPGESLYVDYDMGNDSHSFGSEKGFTVQHCAGPALRTTSYLLKADS